MFSGGHLKSWKLRRKVLRTRKRSKEDQKDCWKKYVSDNNLTIDNEPAQKRFEDTKSTERAGNQS